MTQYINENINTGKLANVISKKVSDRFSGGKTEQFNVMVRDSADLRTDLKEDVNNRTLSPIKVSEKKEIVPKVFKDKKMDMYTINPIPFIGNSIDEEGLNQDYLCGTLQDPEFKTGGENINSHRIPVTNEFRLPPLTDRLNTNFKNFDSSRITPNL